MVIAHEKLAQNRCLNNTLKISKVEQFFCSTLVGFIFVFLLQWKYLGLFISVV